MLLGRRRLFRLIPSGAGDIVLPMSLKKTLVLGSLLWLVAISALHAWLNLGLFRGKESNAGKTFKVGFLPVT